MANFYIKLGSGQLANGPAGGLTDAQLRASPVPVAIGSIALPSGASTSALQNSQITELQNIETELQSANISLVSIDAHVDGLEASTSSIDSKLTNQATSALQTSANIKLDNLLTELQQKADLTDTQPVSISSLPLAPNAATAPNQVLQTAQLTTINTRVTSIDTKLTTQATATNQTTTNASLANIDSKLTNVNIRPLTASDVVTTQEDSFKLIDTFVPANAGDAIEVDIQGYNTVILETASGAGGLFNIFEKADLASTFNASILYAYDSPSVPVAPGSNYTAQTNFKYLVKPAGRYLRIQSQSSAVFVMKIVGIKGYSNQEYAQLSLLQNIASNASGSSELPLLTKNTIISNGTSSGAAQRTLLVGGIYKDIAPSLEINDQTELITDINGNLKVSVQGAVPAIILGTSDVNVTNFPPVQIVTGTVAVSSMPTQSLALGASTLSEQQIQSTILNNGNTNTNSINTIVTALNNKTPNLGQTTAINSSPVVIASNQSTLPVSIASSVAVTLPSTTITSSALPTGAATQTLQTNANASLVSIDAKTPVLGQAVMSSSQPVVIASNQSAIPTVNADDVQFTFVTATPAINYNLVTGNVTTTGWTDSKGFASVVFSVIGTVANGNFTVEQTGNVLATTGANIPFQNMGATSLATNVGVAVTATNEIVYSFPITARYFRIRYTTASTGTVTSFVTLRQKTYLTNNMFVSSGTLSTVVNSGTINNQALTLSVPVDLSSSAITTTTTTGAVTPTLGSTYQIVIPVTVVTGTLPTYDFSIEESEDSGVNWFRVYDFPRITTTGTYRSPTLLTLGNRIRYVQTISGTTPSFTRSILRTQSNHNIQIIVSQIVDRTISLTALNSVTPSLRIQNARNAQLIVSIGAATVAPQVQLEASDDNGLTWDIWGTALTAIPNSTTRMTVSNVNGQLLRARVTTAGASVTPNYILIKGF